MVELASPYAQGFAEGLCPPPRLTVSEWADRHRELSMRASAEPGRWRTARTPYLREIMDQLSPQSPYEIVVLMKGSQTGGSEMGNNFLGYIIHHAPGPAMMVLPTVEMAKRSSKQRIAPMIEECPELRTRVRESRSRDSGNTVLAKEFPGGILIMTGANSAVGLRSMPCRYLFLDEIDGFPHDVDGEGDPIQLAIKRTATFKRNRKIFMCSTPTIKELSRIELAYEQSDKRVYHVPCPACGLFQPILWRNIRWPKDRPREAQLVCEGCEESIPEHQKGLLLANGQWVATAAGDGRTVGYQLSALYSPVGWYSWAQAAEDFLVAKARPEELKTWTNTVLGETWEEEGHTVSEHALFLRREQYLAEVPRGALILSAGVDVQDDRLELEIVGWGVGEESWSIDYRTLLGSPASRTVWEELETILSASYEREGGGILKVAAACIDSAGHHTPSVYEYTRARAGRRIYSIVGRAGEGRPIISAPLKRKTGKRRVPVPLFTVGVDVAKALLYYQLAVEEPGPGYCHFPIAPSHGAEYFEQLTAEKQVTRYVQGRPKREWVKVRRRNEALDCRVYAMAAMHVLNPDWKRLVARIAKPKAVKAKDETQRESVVHAALRNRKRRESWANRWRY